MSADTPKKEIIAVICFSALALMIFYGRPPRTHFGIRCCSRSLAATKNSDTSKGSIRPGRAKNCPSLV